MKRYTHLARMLAWNAVGKFACQRDKAIADHLACSPNVGELELVNGNIIIGVVSHHHMNDVGFYTGWTHHKFVVKPSLQFGFELKVGGRNRNGIKDYLHDALTDWLYEEVGGEL